MSGDAIMLKLSRDEALVLIEWLSELDERDVETPAQGPAERKVLWTIEGQLEKALVEVFDSNYPELLAEARKRVLDAA